MEQGIIVKYGSDGYFSARKEAHELLSKLGDQKAVEELLTPGFITITTKLDAHKVIDDAREFFLGNPDFFASTLLWVPVTTWCTPKEIPQIIKEDIAELITLEEEYAVEIIKHQSAISNDELMNKIVPLIRSKPGYNARKTIRIQIVGEKVAISLLKSSDILLIKNDHS